MMAGTLGPAPGRRREMVRQVMLANDDFDVDAEIVFAAENFVTRPRGLAEERSASP